MCSWNEETVFPIWCHDIWWSILLDNSNRFIDTGLGSIPSVPFRLILSPPYWSWQFSQERTPCSWNMLDNNEPPWRQKFETWLQLFHWEKKMILDELPKSNKFDWHYRNKLAETSRFHQKSHFFSHFGWQFWGPRPKNRKKNALWPSLAVYSRTKPIIFFYAIYFIHLHGSRVNVGHPEKDWDSFKDCQKLSRHLNEDCWNVSNVFSISKHDRMSADQALCVPIFAQA